MEKTERKTSHHTINNYNKSNDLQMSVDLIPPDGNRDHNTRKVALLLAVPVSKTGETSRVYK